MNWVIIFFLLLIVWSIAIFVLAGPSLRRYDKPTGEYFDSNEEDSIANQQFLETISTVRNKTLASRSLSKGFSLVRDFSDNLSADLTTDSAFIKTPCFGPDQHQVVAEWTVANGANPDRRVLFLHGGAFIMGSPYGHRKFADRLSKICAAAVLSVDYRLLPEHARKAGIYDAQTAYQWILNNSPDGPKPCEFLLVAGDSAGGNLALMLSSWSKLNNHRPPDAVIGFSPSLDSSMASPTYQSNRKTDKLLGPSVGLLSFLPRSVILWIAFVVLRIKPSNPVVSPLFYDLTDLPPTLIHASSTEMLLGDAIRYTNKAIEQGSDVSLQVWHNQLHDWHIFNMGTGSAEQAWAQVTRFIDRVAGK